MLPPRSVRLGILATIVAGGFLIGADFSRPDPAGFALGKTTEQEIRQRFGAPASEAAAQVGDQPVTILRYTHSEVTAGLVAARAMVYTFHGGRLVGFDYSSSFAGDQTAFDEAAVKKIRPRETSRAGALVLVGKPTGQFIYPSPYVTMPGRRVDLYSYARSEKAPSGATFEETSRVLAITFDERDVVVETSLITTSTSKALQ